MYHLQGASIATKPINGSNVFDKVVRLNTGTPANDITFDYHYAFCPHLKREPHTGNNTE